MFLISNKVISKLLQDRHLADAPPPVEHRPLFEFCKFLIPNQVISKLLQDKILSWWHMLRAKSPAIQDFRKFLISKLGTSKFLQNSNLQIWIL